MDDFNKGAQFAQESVKKLQQATASEYRTIEFHIVDHRSPVMVEHEPDEANLLTKQPPEGTA